LPCGFFRGFCQDFLGHALPRFSTQDALLSHLQCLAIQESDEGALMRRLELLPAAQVRRSTKGWPRREFQWPRRAALLKTR
jgi:hypothetical protein